MPRHKTNEEFQQEVKNLVGDEYTFLEPYINAYTKIIVKHNRCGNTYGVKPNNFLNGSCCPYCSSKAKKDNAEFKQEVFDLVGNEYVFLDTYVNSYTKIRVKHNKCGNIYEVKPTDFISHNTRCPHCYGTHKKSNVEFKQEIYDLVGNEYTFLDEYINAKTKLKVKHNKCNNVYKIAPHSFLQGRRCPYCFEDSKRKTNTQFKKEVYDLVGSEYTFLDLYVTNHDKLRVKHNKCGNVYEVAPNSFLGGRRCPYCSNYRGEIVIGKILDTLNVDYEYQKTFDDLKDTQLLSYDFFIPDQGILIEYQGIQHYQPVDIFGGEDYFKIQQRHDKMKADYAKAHHYSLIAVPYIEDNLDNIKKYLIKHGLKN